MARRQQYFDLQNPKDVETVHRLLFSESSDLEEDFEDEADTDGEDYVEEREGDSATEQEEEEDEVDSGDDATDENEYVGKDKVTKWSKKKPPHRVRRASHNVLVRLPGVIGDARNAVTTYECWKCFFSEDIIEMIVQYTNKYIEKIQNKFQRERDARTTNVIEIKAVIGLLYLAGVLRSNRQSLEELWGEDGFGVERFRLVMSLKRFKFLMRCMRFDDLDTREIRKANDKLAAVREMFTIFVSNCQKCYSLGRDVTVDEKLEGFRGRCSFRQYIPSKPNKYGLKIYALVDAKMFYTYNLDIYAGKQPEGPFDVSNKPKDVVARLAEPIFQTGRNITCDNWFSSIELLEFLKQKKLSMLGTIRKNKPQLPPEFVVTKSRAVKSNLFCFSTNCSLVSYVPKKGKNVLLISSMHYDDQVDEETGKAQAIMDYNSTKSGVDVVDKLCATYNVARNVRRWPMVIFFALLNVAGINSEIISIANNSNTKESATSRRRFFLKDLSNELCLDQLKTRSTQTVGIPVELQQRLRKYHPTPQQDEAPTCHDGQRKRCSKCTDLKKSPLF